jgi:hypothetical protein
MQQQDIKELNIIIEVINRASSDCNMARSLYTMALIDQSDEPAPMLDVLRRITVDATVLLNTPHVNEASPLATEIISVARTTMRYIDATMTIYESRVSKIS